MTNVTRFRHLSVDQHGAPSKTDLHSSLLVESRPRLQSQSQLHPFKGMTPERLATRQKRSNIVWTLTLPIILSGCAVQSEYTPTPLKTPSAWSLTNQETGARNLNDVSQPERWWIALGDPAIEVLIPAALDDSPTLAQVVARMDEARAILGNSAAQRLPTVSADIGAERARGLGNGGTETVTTSTGHAGLRLAWEIDLFGRVRQSVHAARSRLDARTADARSARLALAAQVARGVVGLRACMFSEQVQTADIASHERVLKLVRARLSVGAAAKVEEARAISSLATASTRAISQREQCAREINALATLTGFDGSAIRQLLESDSTEGVAFMPKTPILSLSLPASVLAAHPDVVAAEREASAAWADIGKAKADRLPRIDLGSLLSENWLRVGGASLSYSTWSLATGLTAPLFDGGAGTANVDAATARYRSADAALRQAVRRAAQEVEDALAGGASAVQRRSTSQDALLAAEVALRSTQSQWEAGAVSLFELEDARRQAANAKDAAIESMRDSAQAWIALVHASGNTVVIGSETSNN
ncbi:MAG: efflux transporter outer membrane subunit [Acidovorax temperans]|uniref:efflux transporter outer membrane subunit n=1 Tax=Acidovorax temperans TaxID=80878 RepID=UPI00391AB9EA